jgi:hypothetical protein
VSGKLDAALGECRLHARTLSAGLREAASLRPVGAERVQSLDDATRRLLDQIAYRFSKLQDTLGEKVLPGLLDRSQEPLAPDALFGEKLQRLERIGAIRSVEAWRTLREVRNAIAHEYPDQPAIQAAMIERLLTAADELVGMWTDAEAFAHRLDRTS